MTISTTSRSAGPYTGTGLVVSYPFSFKVFTTADLQAVKSDSVGNLTPWALGIDFTVSLNADQNTSPGGSLTPLVALAVGFTLTITSSLSMTQPASIPNGSPFFGTTIENAFDRVVILIQQVANTAAQAASTFVAKWGGAIGRTFLAKAQERVTLEDFGAIGDGTAGSLVADTAALLAASQCANVIIEGDPTKVYYISNGVANASGVKYRNCRFKVKLGPGGFGSVDLGITTRYSTTTTLLYWLNSEGGGYENLEVFGDGGGDFVCQPVAVRGGMTTRPFVGQGILNIHDLPGVTNCFGIHGIGVAGAPIDTLKFSNIGTNKSSGSANAYGVQGYWTYNGAFGASDFTQVSCFVVDTDCPSTTTSYGIDVQRVIGRNILIGGAAYAKHGWQSDLVTIGRNSSAVGATENAHGMKIHRVEAYDVGEAVDSQQENVWVGTINGDRIAAGFKQGYMGANSKCESIHINNLAVWAAVIYGGGSGPVADLDGVHVGRVTGRNVGGYTIESGNASVSTIASNFVLGTFSSPYSGVDNYYSQGPYGGAIWITGGTCAGQVRAFSGYVASTRTCTGLTNIDTGAALNWVGGPPDATSTYVITPYARIFAAAMITDSTSVVKNSTIAGIAMEDNLNRMSYITYSNHNVAGRNNRFEVARDLGFLLGFAGAASTGPTRTASPALKAMCQMVLAGGNQTIVSAATPTLVLFGTARSDTYDIPGAQGVQGSPSENGIRVRAPGAKTFCVKLGWTSFTAGNSCKVAIYRNGVEFESQTFWAPTGSTGNPFVTDVVFRLYHAETYKDFRNGGGNENLYQVYVTNSVANMILDSSTASCTTEFTLEG